jgi:hypothetical protein
VQLWHDDLNVDSIGLIVLAAFVHPLAIGADMSRDHGHVANAVAVAAVTIAANTFTAVPISKDAVHVPRAITSQANTVDATAFAVAQESAVIIGIAMRLARRGCGVGTVVAKKEIEGGIQHPEISASATGTAAVAGATWFSVALTSLGFAVEFSVLAVLKRYKSNRESRSR